MSTGTVPRVGEVHPRAAWEILEKDGNAALIDVRTTAEWSFVGIPDLDGIGRPLVTVEWARYPDMSLNPTFVAEVEAALGTDRTVGPLLFICRSGVRSLKAAHVMADHYAVLGRQVVCLNIAEGFEGDLDEERHRGHTGGWKGRGLAWRQT